MEIVQRYPSESSEDSDLSCSHLCMHHCFQHHFSSTPNILSSTRKCNGHPTHQILPHPTSFTSSHPIHNAHLCSPPLRHFLRPLCQKNHRPRIRHLPFTADWIWPLCRNIFNGCSCHYGEKEKGFRQNIIHFLDHPTILNLWILSFSEMFTAVGLIEFFYKQSLKGMQAFLTAMTYCSYSFGFFF
jgi:hypothetical protein